MIVVVLIIIKKIMTAMDVIRRLYFMSYVRIPVKFVLSFWVFKIGYDYY